ncbi:MAG: phage tail protein [Pseudomonadota bacterium]
MTASVGPLPKFFFPVTWDDAEVAFQEVPGLDVETKPPEYRAGAARVVSTGKMPGGTKSGKVTMKKNVFVAENAVFGWFADSKMNTIMRKVVTIALLDEESKPAMLWRLQNVFSVKIAGTNLKVEGNEIAVEPFEIAREGVVIENA